MSLIELIFAMGLGMIVLGVGYRMYAGVARAEQFDSRRHQIVLASQNLLTKIKQDVRSANLVAVSGDSLVLSSTDRRISYRSLPDGVRRVTRGGSAKYPGLKAVFRASGDGVRVRVWSHSVVNRRPVKVDVTTFVRPRG
jgi:hypothetical protein